MATKDTQERFQTHRKHSTVFATFPGKSTERTSECLIRLNQLITFVLEIEYHIFLLLLTLNELLSCWYI